MTKPKKSWQEKLADSKGLPKTGPITGKMSTRWGTGTMVVPAPMEVDELMRRVPKGKLTTIDQLRTALAQKHGVTLTCPITTGIFAWIAAHAADEAARAGAKKVTPYWRTLKSNGELNPKYPGGVKEIKRYLTAEGHKVVARGKRFFVEGFENFLIECGKEPAVSEKILATRRNIRGFSVGPKISREELHKRPKQAY